MASLQRDNDTFFVSAANGPEKQVFDFTLVFEQSILSIGPSALLLLALPMRVLHLVRQHQKVLQNYRVFLKCGTYVVFLGCQITLLTQWAAATANSTMANRVSVAASVLGVADVISLMVLSYMEHNRSVRPSTLILVYFLFSIAFDAVQCRTLWLLDIPPSLAAVFTAMLVSKILILALEVLGKRNILLDTWKSLGPECTSSIIGRGLFWWLNDLIIRGFSATLSLSTLWETDRDLRSNRLLHQIQHSRNHTDLTAKYALFKSVLHCIRWPLLKCIFHRLCMIAFKFCQPFLIKRIIAYVDNHQSVESKDEGYGLVAASALISTGFYKHKVFRSMTMIRGVLVSLILHDTVDLNSQSTSGSNTLTLITSDVDRIYSAFENFHEIWANVIEIGLAVWLLELQLGIGCLGPVATVLICFIATGQVARLTGPATKNWNAAIQKRVSVTSQIIGSIRETKMLGLVPSWIDSIQALRVEELELSKKSRTLMMCMNVLGNTPSKVAPVATFGIALFSPALGLDGTLSTSTAFASLTIMSLIVGPLSALMIAIPDFVSSLGCLERIQVFVNEVAAGGRLEGSHRVSSNVKMVPTRSENIELGALPPQLIDTNLIVACRASFFIKPEDEPVLRNMDIQIQPGSHTIIIGRVGSGKSTLLRGLLGELHTEGFLKTPKTGVAYCAQTPWLFNSTIRQNILGQSEFDELWYKTVLSACELDVDFAKFPDGDLTKVRSKGMTLSGGQKQRINLARAVYSRRPLIIADDILSGLDRTTRKHVWNQVFGADGILRKQGHTVILATHDLSHVHDNHSVIVLGQHRQIRYQGIFASLKSDPELSEMLPGQDEMIRSNFKDSEEAQEKSPTDYNVESGAKSDQQDMSATSGLGDSSLYLYYLKSIGWKHGILLFLLLVAHALMGVLSDIWLRIWTDANKINWDVHTGRYYGAYASISILTLAVIGLDTWFMFVRVIPKSGQRLHLTLLQTAMRAPLSFFAMTDAGDLVNRFSKDMTLVDRDLPSNFWQFVGALLSSLATAGLVLQGASYFGVIVPIAICFLFALQKVYLRTSRQLRLLDLQASAPLYTHLLETLDGLLTIRAYAWQSTTRKEALRLLDEAQKPHYLLFCIQRWLALVLDLFVAACAVILVAFSVALPTSTSAGSVALALVSLIGLSQLLTHVISTWTIMETSLGAISRLKAFEKDAPQEKSVQYTEDLLGSWPARGKLEFQQVTASYSASACTVPALTNISVDIQPGDKVAICGRTGSGKSSLLLALFQLLELDCGSIIIDGLDIRQVPFDELRRRLISMPQEATIFPGSLRKNLIATAAAESSWQPPSNDQLISTLETVELWGHIFKRGGLDTDLEDLAMSHGQKQLLCLARAVVAKTSSRILILDEAMSAVDEDTEEVMTRVIDTEFANHTVLSVMHKLHSLRNFDKVILLEHGHVVETGIPTDLLSRDSSKLRAFLNGIGQ